MGMFDFLKDVGAAIFGGGKNEAENLQPDYPHPQKPTLQYAVESLHSILFVGSFHPSPARQMMGGGVAAAYEGGV